MSGSDMERLKKKFHDFTQQDSGAVAVEYAFIAAVLAAAVVPAINYIVVALGGNFDVVTNAFDTLWQ